MNVRASLVLGLATALGAGGAVAEPPMHWAFVPPRRPATPDVAGSDWPRSPLDAFVLEGMTQRGFEPSPAADREILLRRVTLDLTGLPPMVEAIDAFLADDSPTAYEDAVDHLLDSPHFGERMAVPWLDAARYADSYGYQSDQLSPTWPWRDWVVRAFNDGLPFDDFLTWQLAGDRLPDATRDQRLATAFNRLHRMTNEGGSIEAEYRTEYAADRVHTLGMSILGLTIECARCHDHKYDPITMRDYYGFFGYFNSIDEWGMYNDSAHVPTPSLLLPTPEEEEQLAEREAILRQAETHLRETIAEREEAFRAWLDGASAPGAELPGLVGHYPLDGPFDAPLDGTGPEHRLENLANTDSPGSTAAANTLADGHVGHALRFTGDDAASFPNVAGGLNPWDAFTASFWLRLPDGLDTCLIFHRTTGTDVGFYGTELSLHDGRLRFAIIRFWPGNAIAVESVARLTPDRWTQITVSYDASGRAAGLALALDGQPAEQVVVRDRLTKSPGAGGHGLTFGQRFRDSGLKGADLDDLRVFERVLAPVEVAHLFDGVALTEAMRTGDEAALHAYYFAARDEPVAEARARRATALRELYVVRDGVAETMVMEALDPPRPAFVLERGAYDAPKSDANRIARRTPAWLAPMLETPPADRLELARWITDAGHPLTARVAVNRFWQLFFGRGLVVTSENFGVQGARPSHPELLDWLAVDFVESGWHVKGLCRKLVTSATYRQASALRDDLRERDSENEWLARGPSRRLPAEMLRDLALAASGLLDETMSGPPVSPYQPPGLWREANTMSPAYRQSVGKALHRRSLYTIWKRTAPMGNMIAFDAATREVCTVRRHSTNTPLQAFVLLNDPQFVEAARVTSEQIVRDGDRGLELAFRRFTGRAPTAMEATLLARLREDQRALFAAEPDRAARLLAVGEHPADPALDPVEVAAATVVAQAILNMDATVWKR